MIKSSVVALLLTCLLGGLADAQPSATPPTYYPPQQPMVYQPQQVQLQLTPEDQDTLAIGYISDGQYLGGGLASLFLGFGIGQAVEGRWHDTGWIFTLGEPVAFGVTMYGLIESLNCFDSAAGSCSSAGGTAIAVGLIGLAGLRIWEIIDAFVAPPRHNERFQALQQRLGNPQPFYGAVPFVMPSTGGGAVAGFALRF